jgi:CRP/FNR family cyclic AMP-dependent transcriptional regulator
MNEPQKPPFNPAEFLSAAGIGRKVVRIKANESFFVQGAAADSVFYLQTGRAKLTVISQRGKEATITLLKAGDFIGEESISGVAGPRISSATAITACSAMKVDRAAMVRVLQNETTLSQMFMKFILIRGIRTQEDLVDQLFNSSEKRLARTLLLMAEFGKPGEPETCIPVITQEALADMVGTTRSRVSYFMNRFRKLGYITYNGRIRVHKSLLNVVLHDKLPEQNSSRPTILDSPQRGPKRQSRRNALSKVEQH